MKTAEKILLEQVIEQERLALKYIEKDKRYTKFFGQSIDHAIWKSLKTKPDDITAMRDSNIMLRGVKQGNSIIHLICDARKEVYK
jgi:hypothetical protein